LDLPELATPGDEFTATISGISRPSEAVCQLVDPATGQPIAFPPIEARDGQLCAVLSVDQPGLYRLVVAGGGYSPVEQLVLVTDPTLTTDVPS
jgi:hypothetical protein